MRRLIALLLCSLLIPAAAFGEPADGAESGEKVAPAASEAQLAPSEAVEDAEAADAADVTEAEPAAPAEMDPARIAALIDQLNATEYEVRAGATRALKGIGKPARTAIEAALNADDADAETKLRGRAVLKAIRARALRRGLGEDDRELHIVGCYEGDYPPGVGHGGGNHPDGSATVRIDRPGKAVTLVLTAYEPVRWTVQPSEKTFIEHIIAVGYHAPKVVNTPEGANVDTRSAKAGDRNYFFAYKKDHRYTRMVKALKRMTDLPVASFQGEYDLEATVTVGSDE